nr:MAG TPA: hypothetical protein [Caudoviricetes sp.]DAX69845.1 MAG TPA: hypothetical protein [Caudoviricetes sp.]
MDTSAWESRGVFIAEMLNITIRHSFFGAL